MNILVTGGAGYIGSHVVKQIALDEKTSVTVVDSMCGGDFDSIAILKKQFKPCSRFNFYKFDFVKHESVSCRHYSKSDMSLMPYYRFLVKVINICKHKQRYF